MARSSKANRVVEAPAARAMRRKRSALSEANYVQCKLALVPSFAEHLFELKARHRMPGLDAVVGAMIRKAMRLHDPDNIIVPPPPPGPVAVRHVALHLHRDHYDFLERVAHRNRGVKHGVALEAIGAYVTDLTPAPMQLSLIEGGDAVTG